MLFHTWYFPLFFLVVYTGYLLLRKTRFYLHWLLAASYFFYGWWSPYYLLLILFCTASNYLAVARMEKGGRRKVCLSIAIINSLAVLGFFKYANFLIENLNAVLGFFNLACAVPPLPFLLPVGISFFTFQAMSYAIDYYRGDGDAEPSFIRFATFVAFFPQLVAGPIERGRTLLPQFKSPPPIRTVNLTDGLSWFLVGLFKKIALADYLALYVNEVYAAPEFFNGADLCLATFAFSWQIYFDFSGYTDMARGIARMMGYDLMLNFNSPYVATSLSDFWNRWHISLSTWFKEYVYFPLGGNRKGTLNTYKNMFLTMLISGLWHGAAWTFVVWGALHAVGRVTTRELERSRFYADKVPTLLKRVAVFVFVSFAWIFFRAESWGDAILIVRRLFTTDWTTPGMPVPALAMCLAVWSGQLLRESPSPARRVLDHPVFKVALASLLIMLLFFSSSAGEAFIYFQF